MTMSIHYRVGIAHVTPSNMINRELWRWHRGLISWEEVAYLIYVEVRDGFFHPDTDSDVIKRVTQETYAQQ